MIRSALLVAANRAERTADRLRVQAKWRYDLWRNLRIASYYGTGTREGRVRLRGRVLDDRRVRQARPGQTAWRNALSTMRRILSDEVMGARVRLDWQGTLRHATTDEDGFFTFDFCAPAALPAEQAWHEGQLALEAPAPETPEAASATGHVLVPPPEARVAIVSDLDDTVLHTGATNRLRMARTVLLNNANTRVPFAGVGALYHALQHGTGTATGRQNPLFYVSSSPWNLYDLFQEFFEAHGIPPGPLFLKDYGLTAERFFTGGHDRHKVASIQRLIEAYPRLSFVLIGDSGQRDPEIYRRLAGDYGPERLRAVFIRDVTTPARDAEVHAVARQVERMGVPMFLCADTAEAAEQAAGLDLIGEAAVETVRAAMRREQGGREEAAQGWWRRVLPGA